MEHFEVSVELPVSPKQLYNDWLDSTAHSNFTGGEAEVEPFVDARFTAWDGYISGVNLELEAPKRIVQSWRTLDFPEDAPNSLLEVSFEPTELGTLLKLKHSNLQTGDGAKYEQGWKDNYFEPMQDFYAD